ncbi:MAG: TetR/AcrR family transcriptional regulator [Acidimicrobiales bacterium]
MAKSATSGAQRRRGRVLEDAIHAAVLAELADMGYGRLTMEGVAERARTGKASLYRRWPSKEDLVLDTLGNVLPGAEVASDSGSVREDLVHLLMGLAEVISGPPGAALLAVLRELPAGHGLVAAVHEHVLEPRHRLFVEALQRGVARGEIDAQAVTPLIVEAGPALIVQHHLLHGELPPREGVEAIVDQLLLPALRYRSDGTKTTGGRRKPAPKPHPPPGAYRNLPFRYW